MAGYAAVNPHPAPDVPRLLVLIFWPKKIVNSTIKGLKVGIMTLRGYIEAKAVFVCVEKAPERVFCVGVRGGEGIQKKGVVKYKRERERET
eukprot:1382884-Amorphochlora_amoeboformis.AAC.2